MSKQWDPLQHTEPLQKEGCAGEDLCRHHSNKLESDRLRVSSKEAIEGWIFLTFLSLILYAEVIRMMIEKDLYKTHTLSEEFFELEKLRIVTLTNGKNYLTEVSKRQWNLFEKFEVPTLVAS